MKGLFIDTAGWMMLADGADPLHEAACQERDCWLEKAGILVSTDYVMDETLTLLRFRGGLDIAERWWEQVGENPAIRWEWIDPLRAEKARSLFFRWRDKEFSFTDCTSFVVMRELAVRTALTSDEDFVRSGFERLPRKMR